MWSEGSALSVGECGGSDDPDASIGRTTETFFFNLNLFILIGG